MSVHSEFDHTFSAMLRDTDFSLGDTTFTEVINPNGEDAIVKTTVEYRDTLALRQAKEMGYTAVENDLDNRFSITSLRGRVN